VVLTDDAKKDEVAKPTDTPPVKKEEVALKSYSEYEPPDILPNEGRKEKWAEMRKEYAARKNELKERRAELDSLKQEIAGFDGTRKELNELKSRLEELTNQNAELSKIDSISKLENSPEFRRKYDQAEASSLERLKKLAETSDVPADELLAALKKPMREKYQALDDLLSGVPSALRMRMIGEVEKVEGLQEDRAKELSDAATSLRSLQEQRTVAERQAMDNERKTREAIFDQVYSRVSKDGALDESQLKEARQFFLENDNLERAVEIVIDANRHKLSGTKQKELETRVKELEAQVKQYQGATPGLDAGRVNTTHDDQRPNEDFVDYMKRRVRETVGQ
jgi:hypothetical protein